MSLFKKVKKFGKKVFKTAKAAAPIVTAAATVVFPAQTVATQQRIQQFKGQIAPITRAVRQSRSSLPGLPPPPSRLPPAFVTPLPAGGTLVRRGTRSVRPPSRIIQPSGQVVNMSVLGNAGRLARRVLPGLGSIAGGTALGTVIGDVMSDGSIRPKKRRRKRGFTPRDIAQTRRLLRLLNDMQKACPKPRTTRAGPRVVCK